MIGAILGAGASLLGGLLGLSGQNKTNEFNAEQAQLNRDFQEKMTDKQLSYATEMWNKNNAYNNASAQRQRLEAAGLNPYLMMSGGNAGSASSSSVGSSPSGSTAAGGNPMSYMSDAAQNVGRTLYDTSLQKAQIDNLGSQSEYNRVKAQNDSDITKADVILKAEQAGLLSEEKAGKMIENAFSPSRLAADVEGSIAQKDLARAQAGLTSAMTYMQKTQNKFIPQQIQADLLLKASQVSVNSASVSKIAKDMEYVAWSMKPEIEKATGRKMSAKEANDLKLWLLQYKAYEMENMKYTSQDAGLNVGVHDPYTYMQKGKFKDFVHGLEGVRRWIPFIK